MGRTAARLATLAFALSTPLGAGCVPLGAGFLKPASAPVPATQEIELLDPGQGSTSVPPVVTRLGADGVHKVDVPPAVLVHRYYPSGDRDFQAQMLPGGPMIVAVSHPKTLERVYVPIVLPPGAPRVYYSGRSIVYDYGKQSVTLTFGLHGPPKIRHSQGLRLAGLLRDAADDAADGLDEVTPKLGLLRPKPPANP